MSERAPAPLAKDAAATVALAAYTCAVGLGFARVFSGWDFMSDVVVLALVGHGVSFAMRRARVNGWIAVPILSLVMLWMITLLNHRDTTRLLVPGSATLDRIESELSVVRERFATEVAPVLYTEGWATLAAFALVLTLVMSDSFAFRAEARGEALVPGGVLFVFIAALGSDEYRIGSTVVLIGTGVVAVIALRQLHDRSRATTVSARRGAPSYLVPVALASAAVIAVTAGIVGPRVPGAQAEPLYDTKGRSGTNFIDNPLVDIRSRLTNRGNVELFRVNAPEPRYWRSITLAEFNGEQFKLPPSGRLDDVGGNDVIGDGDRMRQQIQILALGGEVVPAAADAVNASGTTAEGVAFRLDEQREANTLIAPDELRPGDVIDVVSLIPTATPDELRAATAEQPPDPIYLELPDDLPDVLFEQTARVTAGQSTPYDKALALQAWFRDPSEFSYSIEMQSGHSSNAIEAFFRVRVGYCEQFSATFAAMARAAGIPSRVAVGFTPGVQEETGWYSVIGKNSHAWPELWFDGIGWVLFEPTPGRGAPGAEAYTNVAADQDTSGQDAAGGGIDPALPPNPTAPPTIVRPDVNGAGPAATEPPRSAGDENDPGSGLALPDQFDDVDQGGAAGEGGTTDDGGSFPWTPVVLLALAGAALLAPWVIRRVRRVRDRAHAPDEQVRAAWERACHAATDAGVVASPAMTASEWTTATASVLPVAARPMGSLATVVDRVQFSPPGSVDLEHRGSFGDRLSDDCTLWSSQVEQIAVDTLSTTQRVRRYFTELH